MHPMEHLRHVARATGESATNAAIEAATALAGFEGDPAGIVTSCRRLVARHPTSGPMWWLAARVLVAADDGPAEAWHAAADLDADQTVERLAGSLPDDATVTVLGRPDMVGDALRRRGDIRVRVVDSLGEGVRFARRLADSGVEVCLVDESSLGAAVVGSRLVLLEASALGPEGLIAVAGSLAAAAVARHSNVEVWAVAGVGRVLATPLWHRLVHNLENRDDPMRSPYELVPVDLVDMVVGEAGIQSVAQALRSTDCPVAPELLKEIN
jgi:hypothetical protein